MEREQAAENPAVANNDAGVHHEFAVLHAGPGLQLGYFFVLLPVMTICAGLLDEPWAASFTYAVLLLGVGSIWRKVLAPRLLERVQPQEDRAVVNDGDSIASPNAAMAWCGNVLVAAPVLGSCFGFADTPGAALFAYALLLLGVTSIWRAMLAPRPMERVQAEEGRAVVNNGHDNRHEVGFPEAAMSWCGYILVAALVMGSCYGLADTPATALVSYALLLLGFAFIGIAMLPLRPMERFLQEGNRAVRNGNRQGNQVVVPRARGMDWTGYQLVAAPVLASWAGLVEGPAATFFAYALLLLGVAFTTIAMLALAKPKMA